MLPERSSFLRTVSRMSIVGDNIKLLRKTLGYSSVFKFATAVGLPEKRVDAWERGTGSPKVDDTIKIANFFGIDLQLLREGELTEDQAKSIVQKLAGPFRMNFRRQSSYKTQGELSMNEIITMSLMDLLTLQKEGRSGEMGKLVAKLIEYKQRIEELEKENKVLLREMIDILKPTKK